MSDVLNGVLGSLSEMALPTHLALLFLSVGLGFIFGVLPGLTATLGVSLLTGLTYGVDLSPDPPMGLVW